MRKRVFRMCGRDSVKYYITVLLDHNIDFAVKLVDETVEHFDVTTPFNMETKFFPQLSDLV